MLLIVLETFWFGDPRALQQADVAVSSIAPCRRRYRIGRANRDEAEPPTGAGFRGEKALGKCRIAPLSGH
jgi:hypothetical protein